MDGETWREEWKELKVPQSRFVTMICVILYGGSTKIYDLSIPRRPGPMV
jgi:hypothetical protein